MKQLFEYILNKIIKKTIVLWKNIYVLYKCGDIIYKTGEKSSNSTVIK